MMPHEQTDRPKNHDRAALERVATYDTHDTGEVVVGPWVRPEGAEVVDGELVETNPRPTYNTRRLPSVPDEVRQRFADVAVTTTRASAPVVRAGWRHARYLAVGVADVWHATADRATHRDLTDAIKAARARGDLQQVRELEETKARVATARIERAKLRAETLLKLAKTGLVSAAVAGTIWTAVTLGHVGYGLYEEVGGDPDRGFAEVWTPWWQMNTATAEAVGTVASTAADLAPWAAGAAGVAALVGLHHRGRRVAEDSGAEWAQPAPASSGPGEVVNLTPSAITRALRSLGITALRKAIESDPDHGAWMVGLITRYGPGAQVEIHLPEAVTAQQVADRRELLAGNLDRKRHEVQVEMAPDSERKLTLWVADSGALDQPVPPSPLLDPSYGPVDIYRDTMPWGISPKGDPVELNLFQQHFLLAGLSKQGKTAAARALLLWAILDPTVKVMIADLKGFGDWSMFRPVAEHMVEGAGDDNYRATCQMLEWAVDEMQHRYAKRREQGKRGDITREEAGIGSGFEPLIIVIDEVQKLYTCTTEMPKEMGGGPIGGKGKRARAARAAQALHDQARAVNIHLWQFAQNPTDQNLPVVVREGAMIRASLFVGTESIARMALGEAPVDTGAAPHALRAGLDRGTVVLAPGESMDLPNGATHTTVRTHFISTREAWDIVERAQRIRAEVARPAADEAEERDLLADVLDVVQGEEWVKSTDVAARLRDRAPYYAPYAGLNGKALVELLTEAGVRVTKRDGVDVIRPERVREAIAERDQSAE